MGRMVCQKYTPTYATPSFYKKAFNALCILHIVLSPLPSHPIQHVRGILLLHYYLHYYRFSDVFRGFHLGLSRCLQQDHLVEYRYYVECRFISFTAKKLANLHEYKFSRQLLNDMKSENTNTMQGFIQRGVLGSPSRLIKTYVIKSATVAGSLKTNFGELAKVPKPGGENVSKFLGRNAPDPPRTSAVPTNFPHRTK